MPERTFTVPETDSRVSGRASEHCAEPLPPPPWAAVLDRFYRKRGERVPPLRRLMGEEMPSPYRELLVHSKDMTPTLESFYGQPLGLTVVTRDLDNGDYMREVVLTAGARPVEYGAIRILLDHFPPATRDVVLRERRPLGGILQDAGLPHVGWPQAFFKTQADAHMKDLLCLAEPCDLYGRRNVLLDGSRRLLAEVIEILSPV